MRKITYGLACSLDLYNARSDGAVDWLLWSDEVGKLMAEFWPKVDAILMGRKTFEVSLKNAPQQPEDPNPAVTTYVFTRTLPASVKPGLEIVTANAIEFVRDLKARPGKEICLMGGGDLAQSLLEAKLVDEIGLNVHPLLLGGGMPTFKEMNGQVDLRLIENRTLPNGCVLLRYGLSQ